MKKQIICIGQPSVDSNYLKSTIQLLDAMTDRYEILYVEYAFTMIDLLRSFFVKSTIPTKRLLRLKPALQQRASEMFTYTLPPILPYNWTKNTAIFKFIMELNARIVAYAIKKQQQKLDINNPIMINALSPVLGLVLHGKLKVNKSIYYCYDEISQANWLNIHGSKAEHAYIKLVDKVVVSSSELKTQKSKLNPKTFLVPNGVDLELFKVKNYSPNRQKVGYIGTIDERLDTVLLDRLFKENRGIQFEFVGRVISKRIKHKFESYTNVSFLGAVSPSSFSKYLSNWSVGLIPFVKNRFTKSIYPLKANEYLCNGITVLATSFTDLSDFKDHIQLIDTNNSKEVLTEALLPTSSETIQKRKDFAAKNSWKSRANQFHKIIN